jgi:hypothetical protein
MRLRFGNIKTIRGCRLSASTPPAMPVPCATNQEASSRKMKCHNSPTKVVRTPWAVGASTSLCSLKYTRKGFTTFREKSKSLAWPGIFAFEPTYLY